MVAHKNLTGADLHEPKGVASASSGQSYIANGSGSGTWKKITTSEIDTTNIFDTNKSYFTGAWTDVTVAGPIYFVFPFAATVTRITVVLGGGAIGTADEVITCTKNGSSSLGTVTIPTAGSAEGTTASLIPGANNTFTANQWLRLSNNGASTGARPASVTVEFTRTG